jgi:hypothetical protein
VSPFVIVDELFDAAGAAAMVDLCARFGRYRMYAELEQLDTDIGRGLAQRQDALSNFLATGGLDGVTEDMPVLAARTSYFREEYAYGREAFIDGIEPFLDHPVLHDAARTVHSRPVVEPAIAYANLMVPGQELAVHTDVPEFRGCNRKAVPQWLIVVMHYSGLFERWRLPIATGIAWFHDCDGGALAYWPDGPERPPRHHEVRYNTAMVLDTDSVFHGVARIADVPASAMPRLRPGQTLDHLAGTHWAVHAPDGAEVARYEWSDLRFSISWKAYCFADEHERDTWRTHSDDLTIDFVVDRLVDDLVESELVTPEVERNADLGRRLIDTYVRFPAPATD